jgi:predicted regulator of Ras-like GTPase activity (Roadblock/LC7/MglB family)
MQAEDWMIDAVAEVPGVRHVLVTSADGLVRARSPKITREIAEKVGAACAGLYSLGVSVGHQFNGEFGSGSGNADLVMIRFEGWFLFLRRAADGSRLAVVTDSTVDAAVIGQQMALQVQKIGKSLGTAPRQASAAT